MATPPAGRKIRTLCVFYEKGSCKNGDACRFTHGTSHKREFPPQGGEAAGRVSAPAAEEEGPATAPTTKNKKKPCRFFVKGKCTRGESCPFLHYIGDESGSSISANGKNKVKDGYKAGTPDTDADRCTVKSKPKGTPKVKVKVKPSTKAVVDGRRGDNGAPIVTATVTAAKRSAPGEAAAGASQAAAGGPPIKPRLLGSSSSLSLSLSSKARVVGGAVKAAASAGGSTGSWAGIVKTTAADADRASASTSTISTSTTSRDEDMAAVASAAARVKALKAAHQAAKKTAAAAAAAASAAAAAASAGRSGGAAAFADNACITHTFSAGEPTTNTAGRRQQQQTGSTSGSTDKQQEEKKQRANTKPCAFFLRGRCRYGDCCRFSHDIARESEGEEEERGEDTIATKEAAALDEAERIQSRKAECGVCLEVVRRKETVKGRTFGILIGCRHVYCLSCITDWRNKSKSHECPECRVPSPLVVSSKTLVTDPERKARLVSNFQKSLSGGG